MVYCGWGVLDSGYKEGFEREGLWEGEPVPDQWRGVEARKVKLTSLVQRIIVHKALHIGFALELQSRGVMGICPESGRQALAESGCEAKSPDAWPGSWCLLP